MTDQLLRDSNEKRNAFFRQNAALLEALALHGQAPKALYISCSDSRVIPEQLLAAKPGDFFMMRNIANTVPPYWQTEIGVSSILEFAIMELAVPNLIICGHTDCGGILALEKSIGLSDKPALTRWLDLVQPARRQVVATYPELDEVKRHAMIVERNVLDQLDNVRTYPFVKNALQNGELSLHGWVYYLERPEIRYYDAEKGSFVLP